MDFEKIDLIENRTSEWVFALQKNNLRIARFAKIINSFFEGMNEIGDFSCVNRSCFGLGTHISVSSYVSDCNFGRFCMIGSRVSIGGFEHPTSWLSVGAFQWGQSIEHYDLPEKKKEILKSIKKPSAKTTYVGNDVWIGNNVVVKSGVSIADGAIIGAGSVVTKNVGPYEIHVGNPAKFIRKRFTENVISQLLDLRWWSFDFSDLIELNFANVEDCIKKLKKINKNS